MDTNNTPPVTKKLFSFKGNENALEELAKSYPLFAFPEHNLILFEGTSEQRDFVAKKLLA